LQKVQTTQSAIGARLNDIFDSIGQLLAPLGETRPRR
jgi:hypothetical protein